MNQAILHGTPNIALEKIARTVAVLHGLYNSVHGMSDYEIILETVWLQDGYAQRVPISLEEE